MQALQRYWTDALDRQHREPAGLLGQVVGERMLRQHTPETDWTIDRLGLGTREHVLELGFGAGRGLALALQRVEHGLVVGVDRSPAMLRAAAWRNRAAQRAGRLALLRGDLSALPFAGMRFDKLWSIHTFYFWPDPLQICLNLLRLLKPGGLLVVTLATAQVDARGDWQLWPIHARLEALLRELQPHASAATLEHGPNSRQFNNVAMVVRR